MIDIETIWSASLALLASLLGYYLARQSASHFQWFGLAAIVLLFAMACQTATHRAEITDNSVQPTFAGITPIEAKVFEAQWLAIQRGNK